jgi:hypothetical protein
MSSRSTYTDPGVLDTFVTGSASVEWLGANVRLTLFAEGTDPVLGERVRTIVARLVGSYDDMKKIAGAIAAAGMVENTAQIMAGRQDKDTLQ